MTDDAPDLDQLEAVLHGLSDDQLVAVVLWVARDDPYAVGLIGDALDALADGRLE